MRRLGVLTQKVLLQPAKKILRIATAHGCINFKIE